MADNSEFIGLLLPQAPATEETQYEDLILARAGLRVEPNPTIDDADSFPIDPSVSEKTLVTRALQKGYVRGEVASSYGLGGEKRYERSTATAQTDPIIATNKTLSREGPKYDKPNLKQTTNPLTDPPAIPILNNQDYSSGKLPERTFVSDTNGSTTEVPRKKSLRERVWSLRTQHTNSK